jgi:hypothetical protein
MSGFAGGNWDHLPYGGGGGTWRRWWRRSPTITILAEAAVSVVAVVAVVMAEAHVNSSVSGPSGGRQRQITRVEVVDRVEVAAVVEEVKVQSHCANLVIH